MKRIKLSEVIEAYQKLDALPTCGNLYSRFYHEGKDRIKCCALGAVFLSRHPYVINDIQDYVSCYNIWGEEYCKGFIDGFDGNQSNHYVGGDNDYLVGYDDGKRSFDLVRVEIGEPL